MIHKIPYKFAIYTMISILSMVLCFHISILTQIIPFNIVWAGKLNNVEEMYIFEFISIMVNLILLIVIAKKAKGQSSKIMTIILWLFVIVFSLNTLGNLFAKTSLETIVFTPITFISAILCCRIAIKKITS